MTRGQAPSAAGARDASLHAWLDGELSPEARPEVEQWLREHPADGMQVRLWAADAELVRQRLDPVIEESVPMRLEQLVWTRGPAAVSTRWSRLAWGGALMLIGALLGAFAVWLIRPPAAGGNPQTASPAAWLQRAIVAHRVYAGDAARAVEWPVDRPGNGERSAQEAELMAWLGGRLDLPLVPADLRSHGFELLGGRLVPDVSGPAAQLMYQHASGARVTIYVRRLDARQVPGAGPPEFQHWGELNLFSWIQPPTSYAVVGDLPRERLQQLAESVHRQAELSMSVVKTPRGE